MTDGNVAAGERDETLDLAPFDEPVGRPWGRVVVALAVLAVVLLALVVGDIRSLSLSALRDWVEAAGVWAPLAYVALFVLGGIVVVPGTAIMVVGALLFPLPWAFGLVWSGAVASATVCFVLARLLGRGFVARMLGERLARLDDRVGARGFQLVLLMRLAGLPPFNIMNYAAGLTRIPLKEYVVGTALGILPLVVAVVALVGRIGRAPGLRDIVTDPVLYAALLLVAFVVWVAHRMKRRIGAFVRSPDGE